MDIIPQMSLFSWVDLVELDQLRYLMRIFEDEGKNVRRDYPIRATGIIFSAGIVIEFLWLELGRNGLTSLMSVKILSGKPIKF